MTLSADLMAILGIPNGLAQATAITGQGASGVLGGNHIDDEPSNITVAAGNDPLKATFSGQASVPSDISMVALCNHNLDRYRGSYWRAWVAHGIKGTVLPTTAFLQSMVPTAVEASTNLSGNQADVDDDPFLAASESDFIAAAAAGGYTARFSFGTPSVAGSPSVANDHVFVLRVGGALGSTLKLKVDLYEGGVYKETLFATQDVGVTSDPLARKVIILPFSTSTLSNPDGSGVEIHVEGTNGLKVYSVRWFAGWLMSSAFSSGHDTGWLPVDGPAPQTLVGGVVPELIGLEPARSDFSIFTKEDFTSSPDGTVPFVLVSCLQASNQDELAQAGVIMAGEPYRPDQDIKNFDTLSVRVEDTSEKIYTDGGQSGAASRPKRRVVSFRLPLNDRADFATLFERIDWLKGMTGKFFISFYPGDDVLRPVLSFLATLRSGDGPPWEISPVKVGGTDDDEKPQRYTVTYVVEEVL